MRVILTQCDGLVSDPGWNTYTLHATETGISSSLMGHLARKQTSPLPNVGYYVSIEPQLRRKISFPKRSKITHKFTQNRQTLLMR